MLYRLNIVNIEQIKIRAAAAGTANPRTPSRMLTQEDQLAGYFQKTIGTAPNT